MTIKERKAWLKSLKVGDEVAVWFHQGQIEEGVVTEASKDSLTVNGTEFCRTGYAKQNPQFLTIKMSLAPIEYAKEMQGLMYGLEWAWKDFHLEVKRLRTPITTVRRILASLKEANEEGKERKTNDV